MPITKSAIKKLRSDKKKTLVNKSIKTKLKTAVDRFKSSLSGEALSEAFSKVDKAVKKNVIKKAKANRIKSRLSKKVAS
jgi:small subunit ribosomal protein S20